MAALLVALAALGFWAFAALVAAAGIAIWHDEGAGATAALFGIAALSAYPAWLLSRATVRIRHRRVQAAPQLRQTILMRIPAAIMASLIFYFVIWRDLVLAMLPVFVAVVALALDLAQQLEPRKRPQPNDGTSAN